MSKAPQQWLASLHGAHETWIYPEQDREELMVMLCPPSCSFILSYGVALFIVRMVGSHVAVQERVRHDLLA